MKLNTNISPLAQRLWMWGVITAGVSIGLMMWADIPVALYFHDYRDTTWVGFFAAITDFANGAIWYALALIGIGTSYLRRKVLRVTPDTAGLSKDVRAWLFMIASMATSGILINVIKFSVGRERPRFLFREGSADFHPFALRIADCSFPSGHTQSIWAAMLCLSFLFPGMRPMFFLVAILVSASRFIIGAHYLADVVASIFIAAAITLLWRQWFERGGISVNLWGPASKS